MEAVKSQLCVVDGGGSLAGGGFNARNLFRDKQQQGGTTPGFAEVRQSQYRSG